MKFREMDFTLRRELSFAVVLLLLQGCATKNLTVQSEPPGAEVFIAERSQGRAPVEFRENTFRGLEKSGMLEVTLRKDGYADRTVLVPANGVATYTFRLQDISELQRQNVPANYRSHLNELSRELLSSQGLIFGRKLVEARSRLLRIEEKYPDVSATQVLLSSIDVLEEKYEDALARLARAESIDPSDRQIKKIRSHVTGKIGQGRTPADEAR